MALAIAALVSAAAAAGGTALSAFKGNAPAQQNQDISVQALNDARNNQVQQGLIEALINQRSVAGQTDALGSSVKYNPATNQWESSLGPLPEAAQRAAQGASLQRNTVDMRQAQAANEQAALRAARAGPLADAARRELENFRPMGSDALIGALQGQATAASNNTFNPMIADTLRQFSRSGTAAGPVLGQIGRDAATNLRQGLMDAQIKGLTSVDQINQGRRASLEQAATTASGLATPQFQYPGIAATGQDNTMAQIVAQRAQNSAIAPAYGAGNLNKAFDQSGTQAARTGAIVQNTDAANFGLGQAKNALSSISADAGKGGAYANLIDMLSRNNNPVSNQTVKDNAAYQEAAFGQHDPGAYGPWQ